MKKALIPIVVLLTLSTASTTVSAQGVQYHAASFYGYASGHCEVYTYGGGGTALGKGSVHIRGLAIVKEDPGYRLYWAYSPEDPSTRIWTRRTRMTVKWNNEKLTVFMWPSDGTVFLFWDAESYLEIEDLNFMGYYMDASNHLQFIWGTADVGFGVDETVIYVLRGPELYLEFDFTWYGDEARCLRHNVVIWPITWHPTIY